MFEKLTTPEEAYNFKLGAALKMENEVLKILDDSIGNAQDEQVKALLGEHLEESRGHVANVERVFELFGWDVDDSPCPAIEAIHKEAKSNVKKTDDSIVDAIILSGALETEHHEIAVYEGLIVNARAMGREDVVSLLEQNLEQEQHTLREAKSALEKVAASTPQHTA
jgi:ferritin-like metal-binding protein YciE